MELKTVSINFMPGDIIKKYKPLKRISVPLNFEIVYYPYFLVSIRSILKAKLIKERIFIDKRVVSGITSNISKIHGTPEIIDGLKHLDGYTYKILNPKVSSAKASKIVDEHIQIYLNKKYGHPFRPKLIYETKVHEVIELYKPFWVVYSDNVEYKNSMMVVDAVTGIAGVSESNTIKLMWYQEKSKN